MHSVKLSDLATMTAAEREAQLARLVQAATTKGAQDTSVLDARIRRYELRYEMSSETLLERLKRGEQKETAEIANWLFLLNVRGGHVVQ